jgi:hypothetical protein
MRAGKLLTKLWHLLCKHNRWRYGTIGPNIVQHKLFYSGDVEPETRFWSRTGHRGALIVFPFLSLFVRSGDSDLRMPLPFFFCHFVILISYYSTLYDLVVIRVAAPSKAWTVFARSNAGIVGSNPIQGMDVCIVCVYSVFVLFFV